MRRLIAVLTMTGALALAGLWGGCAKKASEQVSPEVQQSIQKAPTVRELRKRGPQPPNPKMRPEGVQPPGKGAQGGGGSSQGR